MLIAKRVYKLCLEFLLYFYHRRQSEEKVSSGSGAEAQDG